jgi:hypothetical protein
MLTVTLTVEIVRAGSATWNVGPTSNDWNTAANWTPATVPNSASDIATFGGSFINSVFVTSNTIVNYIRFNSDAGAYTINVGTYLTLNSGIDNHSSVPQTFAVTGHLTFFGVAPPGTTIISQGGTAPGAAGGTAYISPDTGQYFFGTLIANGGSNGGLGGTVNIASSGFPGAPSRIIANSGGTVDFSQMGIPGGTVATLEGAGDIFLCNNGSPITVVGGNGQSSTFAGVIHDGKNPVLGGVLGRSSVGSNTTLSLTSANTYSGGTIINGYVLEARQKGALGRGDVILQNTRGNAKLTLQGAATNEYISDTATLSVDQTSIVNLNYTGTEAVGFLTVNGTSQSAGLYGGPSSGAPNVVSQFQGTGKILVTTPSAASGKIQGGTTYNLSLPLNRPYAVECRSGGSSNSYEITVGFGLNVTCNGAVVASGNGMVTGVTNGGPSVVISLSDVVSPQTLMLRLDMDYSGIATGSVFVPMNIVVGDVTGDEHVNASDVIQVKSNAGQLVSNTNFRSDVNGNGVINASDITLVKFRSGTALP